MKYVLVHAILLTLLCLSSCIKDEKPNIEVDILEVLSTQEGILNVVYTSTNIDVYADASVVDPSNITLSYVVSEGATISPNPADVHDYSSHRTFIVTSEDGEWEKSYQVRILFKDLPTYFSFENWYCPNNEKYMLPYDLDSDSQEPLYFWSCGNDPFSFLVGKHDDYTAFPTQPTTDAAVGKNAAKLITKLTGDYYKPIAAGNLFIGQFDGTKFDPLESTQFGLPFMKKPLRLTGKYKYRSGGATFHTKVEDRCRIQAILYKTDSEVTHLNGYTIKNSPNIVARAEMTDGGNDTPGEGYIDFDLEFIYTKEIDIKLLKTGGYNLSIIFSASRNGDTYDGAPGSVLLIDDVNIVCESDI